MRLRERKPRRPASPNEVGIAVRVETRDPGAPFQWRDGDDPAALGAGRSPVPPGRAAAGSALPGPRRSSRKPVAGRSGRSRLAPMLRRRSGGCRKRSGCRPAGRIRRLAGPAGVTGRPWIRPDGSANAPSGRSRSGRRALVPTATSRHWARRRRSASRRRAAGSSRAPTCRSASEIFARRGLGPLGAEIGVDVPVGLEPRDPVATDRLPAPAKTPLRSAPTAE